MKNVLSTFCFILFLSATVFAQVNRTGSFVALDASQYPISGDVTLATDAAGMTTVTFESNFATVQGAILEVYLAKNKDLDGVTDVQISTSPLDEGSPTNTPITGMMVFDVPAGINAYEFDNVIVQCVVINMKWGHANLCESDLNLASDTLPSDTYQAVESITCSTALASGSNVNFATSNNISLNAGFDVPLSTEFTTLLGANYGCVIE